MNHRDGETQRDPLTERVIGLAIEVHRQLGPGLLETAYHRCLCWELNQSGVHYQSEVPLPLRYKGLDLEMGYRMDIVIENRVIVELKTAEKLLPIHEAQLLTYLKLSGMRIGLLMNFNTPVLKDGIRRLIN